MVRVFLFYALSGFISLGYQVVWFRVFTDWFGATNLAFALVVCNFIGGLGAGALLSRRLVDALARRRGFSDQLRTYGFVEILVSITACSTLAINFFPSEIWGGFPYYLDNGIWFQNGAYRLTQLLIAVVCIFAPCFFMGVTFPLLCSAFVDERNGERFPSALYAWNTLGACAGVIACQFLFLPTIGHSQTFRLLIVTNLALGGYFLLTGGAPRRNLDGATPLSEARETGFCDGVGVLMACAILSGLLAGALEGDMFKRLSLVIPTNPGATMPSISFWAIASIFLASTLVRVIKPIRLLHIKIAIVIAIVWYVLTWNYVYDVINWLDDRVWTDALMSNTSMIHTAVFPESNLRLFLFTGVYVFPTYFLISLLLPYVCNRIQSQRHHLGLAYGLNTIAFCLGIIGFTLIAPRISIFYSLKLSIALLAIGSAFLLLVRETQHIDLWKPIVAFCFFVVACFIIPSGFDKAYVNPRGAPANYPVSAMKSNGANTTFVVQFPDHRRIFFGNLSMSGTLPAGQTYMRLMAHVPLLLQANPTKALLICFGVGNTAAAIAAHDSIKQIDAVDLNHQVFQTAPEFSDTHGNVHLDPRIRLINDDGRGYLNLTTEKYDLITSEPPPPMAAGVYRLYSKEYYENVLDRMTPEGMMSQWLPIYQMPAEAVGMAIKTFTTVFPHTLLIVGHTSELILVGARNPFDMNLISERFESSEKLTADLRGIRIYDPNDIFVRAIQTDSDLRLNYANYTVISDERNSLEHLFFSPKTIAKVDYTPKNILAWYEDTAPDILPGLVPIITHLGRVRYRVPGFPFSSLKTDDSVRLADLDWNKMNRLERDATKLIRAGKPARAVSRLLAALEEEPEQPWILVGLIQLYFKYQHLDQTRVHAEKLLQVEPDSPTGLLALGTVQLSQGDSRAAVVKLEKYLEVVPDSPFALNNVAWIRATHPDPRMRNPQIALQYAQRASKLTPDSPESLNTMAAAYASANQFEDAIVTALKAIELAREAGKDALAAITYDQLQLYQREQGVTDHALTAATN